MNIWIIALGYAHLSVLLAIRKYQNSVKVLIIMAEKRRDMFCIFRTLHCVCCTASVGGRYFFLRVSETDSTTPSPNNTNSDKTDVCLMINISSTNEILTRAYITRRGVNARAEGRSAAEKYHLTALGSRGSPPRRYNILLLLLLLCDLRTVTVFFPYIYNICLGHGSVSKIKKYGKKKNRTVYNIYFYKFHSSLPHTHTHTHTHTHRWTMAVFNGRNNSILTTDTTRTHKLIKNNIVYLLIAGRIYV